MSFIKRMMGNPRVFGFLVLLHMMVNGHFLLVFMANKIIKCVSKRYKTVEGKFEKKNFFFTKFYVMNDLQDHRDC